MLVFFILSQEKVSKKTFTLESHVKCHTLKAVVFRHPVCFVINIKVMIVILKISLSQLEQSTFLSSNELKPWGDLNRVARLSKKIDNFKRKQTPEDSKRLSKKRAVMINFNSTLSIFFYLQNGILNVLRKIYSSFNVFHESEERADKLWLLR